MSSGGASFLQALCTLRGWAVACQVAVAAVVLGPLALPIPVWPLVLGPLVLVLFNGYALWRARRVVETRPLEALAHIAVDVAVLAWLVAWGGGIANPFTSLFLLPIAFAALALPPRWMVATAALCGLGYALSAIFGRPLPHVHGALGDSFDLHLWGMVVNFLISVAVVLYVFSRLARALRQREQELAALRERFARNEGIVALATHAAAVAHELNTPLGTLTLLLDDRIEQEPPPPDVEEFRTLRALVDVCRDRVRALARPADAVLADADREDLEAVIARWQLVRPTVHLERSGAAQRGLQVEPALAHLLQALLNNAADASAAVGEARVDLHLEADTQGMRGEIRDYGAGFGAARHFLPGTLHASSKPDGMGVGLALSHATVERLGGTLTLQAVDGPGVRVCFQLPGGVHPPALEPAA